MHFITFLLGSIISIELYADRTLINVWSALKFLINLDEPYHKEKKDDNNTYIISAKETMVYG